MVPLKKEPKKRVSKKAAAAEPATQPDTHIDTQIEVVLPLLEQLRLQDPEPEQQEESYEDNEDYDALLTEVFVNDVLYYTNSYNQWFDSSLHIIDFNPTI